VIPPPPRVIVIDDEPGMLGLIERIIAPIGCQVALYTSPQEALARLATVPVDVAIADLRMQEYGGQDVQHAVRAARPH